MGKGILRYRALAAKDHRKAMLFRSVLFAAAGIFKLVSIYTHQSGAMGFALAIPMFGFSGYFYYRSRRPAQTGSSKYLHHKPGLGVRALLIRSATI